MDIRIYIDDKRPVHKCRAVDTLEPGELEFVCTYPGCNYSRLFRADGSTEWFFILAAIPALAFMLVGWLAWVALIYAIWTYVL